MIQVRQELRLAAPIESVWEWMADLERLVTADVLHRSVEFVTPGRWGVGTTLLVPHGVRFGPRMPRRITITHWEERRRIRWTDVDVAAPRRRYVFPHAEEFILTRLDAETTLLTDTVTGALNLRIPLLGWIAEAALETLVVRRVVRAQGRRLGRQFG